MNLELNINAQTEGYFTFVKGKADADGVPIPGTEETVAHFRNLVTNNGLDRICDGNGGSFGIEFMFPRCYVGTGSTTPAITDSALASYLATSTQNESNTSSYVEGTPAYWKNVKVYRFTAGTATGNLTEVGVGWTNTDLFSRALILDGGGTPTTITVLADEYLDVTYECRNYIDKTQYSATISISGVPYDIIYKPADIDGNIQSINISLQSPSGSTRQIQVFGTQTLGTVYERPSGTPQIINGSLLSYTNGTYYVDMKFDAGLDEVNITGGIGSLVFLTNISSYQVSFTPKIPKDATKIMSLTFRIAWTRYP